MLGSTLLKLIATFYCLFYKTWLIALAISNNKMFQFHVHSGVRDRNIEVFLANCHGKKIDWNAQDNNGDTALHIALKCAKDFKSRNNGIHYDYYVKHLKTLLDIAETLLDVHLLSNGNTILVSYIQIVDAQHNRRYSQIFNMILSTQEDKG